MRAIYIERSGGYDVLKVRETPAPQPRAGELAISVRAAGINFADILARQGLYPPTPPYPCIVGYEVAGTVTSVGAGVDQGWVRPHVDRTFRFDEAGAAHAHIEGRGNIGKVLLLP